ncbi:hypothetical protein BDR04DRAFT_1111975, partial [Suillus decipiens]
LTPSREANIAAAIHAVREKRAKNLLAAAGEVNKHHVTVSRTGAFPNYILYHNQDQEAGGVARHSHSLAITRDRTQSRSTLADSAAL